MNSKYWAGTYWCSMPKASEVSVPKDNVANNIDSKIIEINVTFAPSHTIRKLC